MQLTNILKSIAFTTLLSSHVYGQVNITTEHSTHFHTQDALRFAELMAGETPMTTDIIQTQYLDVGSRGIEIFTPNRIQNAHNLLTVYQQNEDLYTKAVDLCLPATQGFSEQANRIAADVAQLLQQSHISPTYIVFGAANSGGTADDDGLVIGIEVLCYFADDAASFVDTLKTFVAHESVHVYQKQYRDVSGVSTDAPQTTLLRAALLEGFADFTANHVLGYVSAAEIDRHTYGVNNEAKVWQAFKKDMMSSDFGIWMYQNTGTAQPNDMAYWVGKRIAESYYQQATDKQEALQTLLALRDPEAILSASGYNPQ